MLRRTRGSASPPALGIKWQQGGNRRIFRLCPILDPTPSQALADSSYGTVPRLYLIVQHLPSATENASDSWAATAQGKRLFSRLPPEFSSRMLANSSGDATWSLATWRSA